MSVPFHVAPAIRTGNFGTGDSIYNGGFTELFWNWDIPSSVDYNDPNNHIGTQVILDGGVFGTSQWDGGNGLGKNGFPGAVQFNISNWVSGQVFSVNGSVSGSFNVGIASGLISSVPA